MCKTCGCGDSATMQIELHVKNGGQSGLQTLYAGLMGAPGILHVQVDESTGQVLADFSPQRTSQQNIENLVAESGYEVISAELREPVHHHGVVAFIKRAFGKHQ